MFGAICAGRPVQTNLQVISPTQFAFTIPSAPSFNHIVVFLLPGNVLPNDMAAAVYIRISAESDFQLLGAIGNEKQSAIFRVNNAGSTFGRTPASAGGGGDDEAMVDDSLDASPSTATDHANNAASIILGISIEPAGPLGTQLASLKGNSAQGAVPASGSNPGQLATRAPSTKILAQRIIKNAFNFLASFVGEQGGVEVVPLRSFQDWWNKFEKRLELDPGFLDRTDDQ
ncbi:DUF775-domain-containing protein [Xylona heveae TC161]|uniref:DUF775-domain-containing protein n=1 Tax=Xylona heveae (strain CBS 132557 / TC161) TaxID=1328760 RepID=A0A165H8S1_XYLHT|nr:DUF775-domain-containing protein [Xylona heveae TC161]KZF23143.1 DUF775-domain-containing protein [Xylona heveae TC161]